MSNQWYSKRWFTFSAHLLTWIIFFAFPFLMSAVIRGDHKPEPGDIGQRFNILIFLTNILRCIVFYLNAYLLIPQFINRRKYIPYILLIILIIAVTYVVDRLLFSVLITEWNYNFPAFFVFNVPILIFILMASSLYRFIKDRTAETRRIEQLENENLKTELALLRSQVSPHFMFNVLNNMVALARKKSDLLEPSLIKLSNLLRYMLYETNEDKVLLENEVAYLESYIDLQKQRFGKNIRIVTDIKQGRHSYNIEPMLLIPFVENAFKHGSGLPDSGEIHIYLEVNEGTLQFTVRNRFIADPSAPKDKTSGIGLANVKRRLDLLYNQNHILNITSEDGWFNIFLQFKLH